MLILQRKAGESLVIGEDITIRVAGRLPDAATSGNLKSW